ncbi:MAG: TonB-dependent receptor [Cyclobacteriaceae bacterium]|nr:TonB-dependent receptor [Cyclobacteriaceae bacterium]
MILRHFAGIYILFMMLSHIGAAQKSYNLQGVVKDLMSGEMLPGANVYLPELKKGTVTDATGRFSLSLNEKTENLVLQVSMLGYKTEVRRLGSLDDKQNLVFALSETGIMTNEVIVSAGRIGTRDDIPVQVDMITAKEMRTDGEINIMSSIVKIPGVEQISFGNGIGKPVIRGMSFSRVLSMYQRARFENHQWGADHGLGVNDLGIESIEIIKGPASFLYGSGALGGVIYMVDERNAPVGSMMGDINSTFFSNSLGMRQTMSFKETKDSGWFYGIQAAMESHADYIDGNGRTIGNSRFNTRTLRANTGWQKNWGTLRLGYTYHRQNLGIIEDNEMEETLATSRNDRSRQLPFQEVDDHLVTLTGIIPLGDGRFEGNVGFHYNSRKEIEDDFEEIDLGITQNNTTFDFKYIFNTKANWEHIVGTQGFYLNSVNMDDAEEILIPDVSILDGSLYYLGTIRKNKSTFQAGLRYDTRRTTGDATAPLFLEYGYTLPGLDVRTHTVNHSGLSGSIGGIFDLTDKIIIKSNFSSGFRAPDKAELFSNGEHPGTQRFEVGNVNFEREQNYQLDMAFLYKGSQFNFEFSPYYNYISNYIYFTPTGTEIPGTELIVWEFDQENARLAGFEVAVVWKPLGSKVFTLDSRYSMIRGVNPETGAFMPLMPADRWINSLQYKLPDKGRWNRSYLKLTYNYMFEQNRLGARELEVLSGGLTPAFSLLGFGIGTSLSLGNQLINLDVTATNLLNEAYVDHLSFLRPFDILNLGRNVSFNMNIPLNFR